MKSPQELRNLAFGLDELFSPTHRECEEAADALRQFADILESAGEPFLFAKPLGDNTYAVCGQDVKNDEYEPLFTLSAIAKERARADAAEEEIEALKHDIERAGKINSYIVTDLEQAIELLREIRDGDVNARDKADKFLRGHGGEER